MNLKCISSMAHAKPCVAVDFSPNDLLLASAGADKKIYIVNATSGENAVAIEEEFSDGMNDVCWLTDEWLVIAGDDGFVRVLDVKQNKIMCSWKLKNGSLPYALAIHPRNGMVTIGDVDGWISSFHINSKECLQHYPAHSKTIVSVEYSPDGKELLTGSLDGTIRQWQPYGKANLCLRTIVPSSNGQIPVGCASYSDNGEYILASTLDSIHRIYASKIDIIPNDETADTALPIDCKSFSGHRNVKFACKSRTIEVGEKNFIISGSEDGKIYLWDVNSSSSKPYASYGTEQDVVLTLAIKYSNMTELEIATGGRNGSVKIWTVPLEPQLDVVEEEIKSSNAKQVSASDKMETDSQENNNSTNSVNENITIENSQN